MVRFLILNWSNLVKQIKKNSIFISLLGFGQRTNCSKKKKISTVEFGTERYKSLRERSASDQRVIWAFSSLWRAKRTWVFLKSKIFFLLNRSFFNTSFKISSLRSVKSVFFFCQVLMDLRLETFKFRIFQKLFASKM